MSSTSSGIDLNGLEKLLPSEAKEVLTNYFLNKMKEMVVNFYGETTFRYNNALNLTHDIKSDWVRNNVYECYEAALKEWKKEYGPSLKCPENSYFPIMVQYNGIEGISVHEKPEDIKPWIPFRVLKTNVCIHCYGEEYTMEVHGPRVCNCQG